MSSVVNTESISATENKMHPFYLSLSFWSLLVANVAIIVWAMLEEWSLGLMIWVYFCQNIILGLSWTVKVFESGYDESYEKKLKIAAFFMPQYFIAHFGYGYILFIFFGGILFSNYKYILSMAGVFLVSEMISLFAQSGIKRKPLSLAQVQLFPYARILPMHLLMFLGIGLAGAGIEIERSFTLSFLILKALADTGMFVVERSLFVSRIVTNYFDKRMRSGIEMGSPVGRIFGPEPWYESERKKYCSFCQRQIMLGEETHSIKDKIVCLQCYQKIDAYKKNKA
jgi:hypothetical protein